MYEFKYSWLHIDGSSGESSQYALRTIDAAEAIERWNNADKAWRYILNSVTKVTKRPEKYWFEGRLLITGWN